MRRRAVGLAIDLFSDCDYSQSIESSYDQEVMRQEKNIIETKLGEIAQTGNTSAYQLLAIAGCDSSLVVSHARSYLKAVTAPRVHKTGVSTFGLGLSRDAILISVLDIAEREAFVEAMLHMAVDPEEVKINCQDALFAVGQIVTQVSQTIRKRAFDIAMKCARGEHDGGSGVMKSTEDLLSRIQLNFGSQSLRGPGIYCAALSASDDDEYRTVRELAFQLLTANDSLISDHAATTLEYLPVEILVEEVDADFIRTLAVDSNEHSRAIAALCWTAMPDIDLNLGLELASDPSFFVRGTLAGSLSNLPGHEPVARVLIDDPRRSVRSAVQNTRICI